MNDFLDDEEWSAEEQAQLASLARDRIPSHELKGRTLVALHAHGYLAAPNAKSPRRMIALLAAASVIFIAGAVVGYLAARREPPRDAESRMANREQVAQSESATTTQPVRHVVWY